MRDALIEFWEIITGVLDDNKSKLIKLSCFGILFFGMMWAALNYFRANRIADTNVNADEEISTFVPSTRAEDEALYKLESLAKTVGDIRNGGEAIANKIIEIHTKPFNIEGYDDGGLEALDATGAINSANGVAALPSSSSNEQQPEDSTPVINIRAIMMSGSERKAVIDAGGKFGIIVSRGSRLPQNLGRVTRINSDGITVRFDNKEIKYDVIKTYAEAGRR